LFPNGDGSSTTRQMKSRISIQPVASGSYCIHPSNKAWTSSPSITPEFYCLAFSRPSMTAATERFMMSQAMTIVKTIKNGMAVT